MIRWMRGEVVLRINFHVSALPEPAELLRQKSIRPARAACICPNYVTLIMFPPPTVLFTQCARSSPQRSCMRALPPSRFLSLAGSLLPSLHVGSSLRLHFSCLGSLLSSPANKSSANLLPESLCPCSDCSSPWLLGNTAAEEGLGEAEQAEQGGGEREGGSE